MCAVCVPEAYLNVSIEISIYLEKRGLWPVLIKSLSLPLTSPLSVSGFLSIDQGLLPFPVLVYLCLLTGVSCGMLYS